MPTKNNKKHLAFSYIGGEEWLGGKYYLINILLALKQLPLEFKPKISLLVKKATFPNSVKEFESLVDSFIVNDYEDSIRNRSLFKVLSDKLVNTARKENYVSFLLRKHSVDFYFSSGKIEGYFAVPVLSWIPDFQHIHYPKYFTTTQIKQRNSTFINNASIAKYIIVSSNDCLADLERFCPEHKNKSRVIQFVSQVPEYIYNVNPLNICKKYNLPNKFFLLSNQFWKHKNHMFVIESLKEALRYCSEIKVVCTGNLYDFRDTHHINEILQQISFYNIRQSMIILGMVPRDDLFCLMRQSIAVLQPSQFEGWNSSIEEAKTLGKKVLASAINVHLEQDAPEAQYFSLENRHDLSSKLCELYESSTGGPDYKLEQFARNEVSKRTIQFAKNITDAMK